MIPIGDNNRARTFPYVNYAIILLNFLVFFYELYLNGQQVMAGRTELEGFIDRWGNVPACTFDAVGWDRGVIAFNRACTDQPHASWTPVTAMFIHLGWLHILGNMLFLWVFGDNIEDAMGHALYAVFYLVVGIAAAMVHGLTDVDSLSAAVGASGAVAGVMGAYIVLFPRALVVAILPPLFFLPLPVPAFIVIGLWFLVQLVWGFASLGPEVANTGGGIAYFAHIGGFVAGALLVRVFAINRPRARRSTRPIRPRETMW
ncbi:MAG: rhomboid family intramembrane serine protease [Chloroflexi bacterium]|nr:rhomboid family intramembrane serine protease [Chloroflexota bacterium]